MNLPRGLHAMGRGIAVRIARRRRWIVTGFLYKLTYLKAIAQRGFKRRTIITYPQRPRTYHSLYKIAHILGYRLTCDPRADAVACVAFHDTTVHEPDDTLAQLARSRPVINLGCTDISKKHVGAVFEQIFGYSLTVDPCTFIGDCVKKSNTNGKHDGVVITCPIPKEEVDPACIYQRVVSNRVAGSNLLLDIRVPMYNKSIPLVFLRYRDPNSRFDGCLGTAVVDVADVLSPEEIVKTRAMCRAMGLDLGELDILRDLDDGRMYIVDVNKTPAGPLAFSRCERRTMLDRMATTFERTLLEASADSRTAMEQSVTPQA